MELAGTRVWILCVGNSDSLKVFEMSDINTYMFSDDCSSGCTAFVLQVWSLDWWCPEHSGTH